MVVFQQVPIRVPNGHFKVVKDKDKCTSANDISETRGFVTFCDFLYLRTFIQYIISDVYKYNFTFVSLDPNAGEQRRNNTQRNNTEQ